jgi:release factor glutamine methyltransferase
MTVAELLVHAQNAIQLTLPLTKQEASLDAQLLLQHTLHVNRAWVIAHADDALSHDSNKLFQTLLQRRLQGEPIAYILGAREFYGLQFKVTTDTLIPRPDTETLVDIALTKILKNQHSTLLDLGTGTGAIALSIAKYRPQTQVTAVDASEHALNIAKENAQNLNIPNVNFVLSHWFKALQHKKFDVIVSNPPYIEEDDLHLSQGDLRFEPLSALASGNDGLNDIRHIIAHSKAHLNPNGWLMLEHGYNQAENIAELLNQFEFNAISHVRDLAGIERVTIASN